MIEVLSVNVCGLPSRIGSPHTRAVELCRRIEASGADVVLLQELWTGRLLRSFRRRLPSFGAVGWRPGPAGQPAGGLATFARRPLGGVSFTSFRSVRPPGGPPVFRALKALNSAFQGVLTVRVPAHQAVVANTHLSANRDGDWSTGNRHFGFQRAQLAALHAAVRPRGLSVLGGDFNIPSASDHYPAVVGHGAWRDPFAAADEPTFHRELLPPGRRPHRIDYLLVAGDRDTHPVTAATVLFGDTLLSDHLGLMVRVGRP